MNPFKIFFDTEFLEGHHKPPFGKRRHHIDLVSIGLVDQDGREYSALSKDFNPSDANDWVKANVFPRIVEEYKKSQFDISDIAGMDAEAEFHGKTIVGQINYIQDKIGKTDKKISEEIVNFVFGPAVAAGDGMSGADEDIKFWLTENQIEFVAHYADYDWVLFCSLFGSMMDLPTGFPMYCTDTIQMMHQNGLTPEWKHRVIPDPVGEHNALVDARWTKAFYYAIQAEIKDSAGR